MKIPIKESVLRQVLEAVDELLKTSECCSAYFETDHTNTTEAITALRTALDAAEKVEPIGEVVKATGSLKDIHIIRWLNDYSPNEGDKLYAAQTPPTNTDSELREAARAVCEWCGTWNDLYERIDRLRKAL